MHCIYHNIEKVYLYLYKLRIVGYFDTKFQVSSSFFSSVLSYFITLAYFTYHDINPSMPVNT